MCDSRHGNPSYTVLVNHAQRSVDPGGQGENVDAILTQLQELAALGITHTHTGMKDASSPADFELFGEKIIPEAAKF